MIQEDDNLQQIRVAVAGGSIGGLCAGLALRCAGCNVEIFEKSPREMEDRGAGLVVQMELLHYLEKHGIATREAVSVPARMRQYLRRDGSIAWAEATYQLMTSWSTIYRQLRDVFPTEHYHHGHKLIRFEQGENQITACFENGHIEHGHLLVGADGANSTCRRQLLPAVQPEYAGYVAWRGLVNESDLAPSVAEVFAERFTFFQAPNTHILCYLIPGAAGEVVKGKRRFNWVWYWNVPEGEELRTVLTDRTGLIRDYSAPQGTIRRDLVQNQQAIAEQILPEVFQQLFAATQEPFIQPIYDLWVPRMAFGRVCLTGDAAFVPRPHTAASTAKAVTNAIELAEWMRKCKGDVLIALQSWEPTQLELGNYLKIVGMSLGNRSQFGSR